MPLAAACPEPDVRSTPTRTLSTSDFRVAREDRYFEDYLPGAVYEYGYLTVTEAEILEFARRFDPQPIHIDPGFAATGPFGGLIASGWHTAGLLMRLFLRTITCPGWPASRRPASTSCAGLRRCGPVISCGCGPRSWRPRLSRSKPDRGLVRTQG